jgi:hypothetical protein
VQERESLFFLSTENTGFLLNIPYKTDMFGNGSTDGHTVIENIPAIEILGTLIVVIIAIITK